MYFGYSKPAESAKKGEYLISPIRSGLENSSSAPLHVKHEIKSVSLSGRSTFRERYRGDSKLYTSPEAREIF